MSAVVVIADTFLMSIGGDGITGKRIYESTRELPPSQVLASKLAALSLVAEFMGTRRKAELNNSEENLFGSCPNEIHETHETNVNQIEEV